MTFLQLVAIAVLLALSVGCVPNSPAEQERGTAAKDPPPALTGHELKQAIQDPVDRARAMQKEIDNARQALDHTVDEQSD